MNKNIASLTIHFYLLHIVFKYENNNNNNHHNNFPSFVQQHPQGDSYNKIPSGNHYERLVI